MNSGLNSLSVNRRVAAALVTIALGCLGRMPSVRAEEPRPIFRASVAVVPITAIVRDSRHRIVRDLSRKDFQVLENNQPRPILDFRAAQNAPVRLALVVDTSGSMRGANLESARKAVEQLLTALNPLTDEVALFTFDKVLRQETPFTDDSHHIRKALHNTDAWGLTSLYDAIGETAKRVADHHSQPQALIVITDGLDTSSSLTAAEVSGIASSIDVPVYIISIAPPSQSGSEDEDGDLAYLAYWTGGDVRYIGTPDYAGRVVGGLVAELRHQYFLAIESAADTGWYRLDVRTGRRGLTVRSRSGYFAGSPGRTSGE